MAKNLDDLLEVYFQGQSALIVEENKSLRSTVRNVLTALKLSHTNISILDNYPDAETFINDNSPNVVIVSNFVSGRKGADLLKLHIQKCANRSKAVFFVVTEDNSIMNAMMYVDTEVDGIIPKPVTFDTIRKALLQAIIPKLSIDQKQMLFYEAKALYLEGKYEDAQAAFDTALAADPDNSMTHLYLGKMKFAQGKFDEALAHAKRSEEINDKNYQTLNLIFECHMSMKNFADAYKATEKKLSAFPVSAKKIPEYIKMCVALKSHQDIMFFTNFIKEYHIRDPFVLKNTCAGLVMAAIYLIGEGNDNLAIECLDNASSYAANFPKILQNIAKLYLQLKAAEKADEVVEALIEKDPNNNELKFLRLEVFHAMGLHKDVIGMSQGLLKNKLHSRRMYECLVDSSLKLGKSRSGVREIIEDCLVHYPELKTYFAEKDLL